MPPNLTAVDGMHAVSTSVCYGCHKSLDPMRQFWGNFYDFNDKAEGKRARAKPASVSATSPRTAPRCSTSANCWRRVTDTQVDGPPLNRFALAMTQKLCFFANSSQCEETDPEMRRIARAFADADYDWKTLVRELFARRS